MRPLRLQGRHQNVCGSTYAEPYQRKEIFDCWRMFYVSIIIIFCMQKSSWNHLTFFKKKFYLFRCGESFTNAAKLVTHMRTIHGTIDKTYQCESCEYRGATHSALKAHMRAVHENVRKHRCDYCEFTSFASSALKRHILAIHEKRKPFECDKVCKTFF